MKKNVLEHLRKRGYVYQTTNEESLNNALNNGLNFYIGFDPTADSLHVGHFLTMMAIKQLQKYGNKPIILIGGGTGFVGDPSGRSDMRKMIDKHVIEHNCACFKKQMEKFIDFEGPNKAIMVNNADWLLNLKWIDFLREFGTCFTVNKMLTAEAFKTRFSQELGLSFLEFNYMLMQAYDYYYLFKSNNVTLELGGSDQWSNILAGVDLIRRKESQDVHAITLNLLTKSDGTKMGKTANGAVWLDSQKTSPYDFYQYWLNVDDVDVKKFLYLLTELDETVIEDLCKEKGKKMMEAKKVLAYEVTSIVHGKYEADKSVEQSKAAFENTGTNLPEIVLQKNCLNGDDSIINILVLSKLSPSKSESRRLIQSNAISINDLKINNINQKLSDLSGVNVNNFIIHKGKKNHIRIIIK